jgi:hypothetical protein
MGTGLAIRVSRVPSPLVTPLKKAIGSRVAVPAGSSTEVQEVRRRAAAMLLPFRGAVTK